MITGCDCPACGLQRMVMALFKGEFKEAFWLNPYLAILFPYFFALVGAEVFKNQPNFTNFVMLIRFYINTVKNFFLNLF